MASLIDVARKGFNIYFRDFNLDDYLRNAEGEVSYEPHNNGFYLKNKDVRMGYILNSFCSENSVNLWFLKTNPKLGFFSSHTNMKKIPECLICDDITLHTGSTSAFSFPLDDRVVGNTIIIKGLDIDPYPTNPPKIEQEWFEEGTELIRYAAEKYNLKSFYKKYAREFLGEKTFLERILSSFSSWKNKRITL